MTRADRLLLLVFTKPSESDEDETGMAVSQPLKRVSVCVSAIEIVYFLALVHFPSPFC